MNIEINNNMNVNTDEQNINLDYDNNSSQMLMEDGKPSITIPQTTMTVESGVGSVSTGGTTDHAKLKNLDYEHSGHTGFQKAGNYALKSDIPDTSDFIKDSDYVHTDNNFTDEHKEKLDGLESLSGKAIDISYEDNYGYEVDDVQGALDKAFDTLDNKMDYKDFTEQVGHLSDLDTEDTSTIVNAINSLVSKGGGIQELSGDINIYDLEQGIYLLSGANTRLLRSSYAFMSKPVLNDYSKSILIFIREAQYGEQGFILKASTAGPYVQLYVFDRTTLKEYNAMQLMSMNNTTSYSVTHIYQPAHKQYVDGQINKLRGEIGGINELGEIDMQEWDDDMDSFMGSLTDTGRYHFIDSWDNFDWLLEVETVGNRIGQRYWYQEEGFILQYYRDGWYDEDEDDYFWNDWTHYLDWNTADYMFARKEHNHYSSVNTTLNIRTWLDSASIDYSAREYNVYQNSDKKLFYVRVFANNYVLNNAWRCMRYQEYYDTEEPSKIYKRVGTANNTSSSATVTWQPWYVFEGKQVQ